MEYYVFNKSDAHIGWMDNCIVWWRAEGYGYTYDLNDAGVFTEEDKIKGYPSEKHGCIYVPKELADSLSYAPKLLWWTKDYGTNKSLKAELENFSGKRNGGTLAEVFAAKEESK